MFRPPDNLLENNDELFQIKEEEAIGKELVKTLNEEQRTVYNTMMKAI